MAILTHRTVIFSAFAKLRKATLSFVMSVRPHGTSRLLLDGFLLYLIFEYFSKICLVKHVVKSKKAQIIWRMRVACLIGKATHAQAHPRVRSPTATPTRLHLPTPKHVHNHKYLILIAFPWQHLFRERASVLGYTYVLCLSCCQYWHTSRALISNITASTPLIIYHSTLCSVHKYTSVFATTLDPRCCTRRLSSLCSVALPEHKET